ncbi:MAG: PadR family transcriptional regulator [Nanoarchaeota archaeon]|nr:PadR family transcriptional regulator [Nanoarchaeota archaeon]
MEIDIYLSVASQVFELKELILKTLSKSPKHGYQLAKDLGKIMGKEPSIGGMYPILKDLEDNNLILGHSVVDYGRYKKIYKLTKNGLKEVERINRKFKELAKFMS